jgi:hypothetical protein
MTLLTFLTLSSYLENHSVYNGTPCNPMMYGRVSHLHITYTYGRAENNKERFVIRQPGLVKTSMEDTFGNGVKSVSCDNGTYLVTADQYKQC